MEADPRPVGMNGATTISIAKPGALLYAKDVARLRAFYSDVAGLALTHEEVDHAVLESSTFQLVIHAIPADIAATISISTPPERRADVPVKLVFPVASIDAARGAAGRLGGELNPDERVWKYQGCRICDGHDPEGNVVQFREQGPGVASRTAS
jgi:predicted enzyme related to lactoylglutathione lyase